MPLDDQHRGAGAALLKLAASDAEFGKPAAQRACGGGVQLEHGCGVRRLIEQGGEQRSVIAPHHAGADRREENVGHGLGEPVFALDRCTGPGVHPPHSGTSVGEVPV